MAELQRRARELTVRDRLSRLDFQGACSLLGAEGASLIRKGGGEYSVNLDEHVRWDKEALHVRLNGAVVTIASNAAAKRHLSWRCTQCKSLCQHVGAAFSLILEEKTALGLAAAPAEAIPHEALSEEELVRCAMEERRERAAAERMTVKSIDAERLWTDYLVTSAESGRTYRVALRGWSPGESYCSCPDFRKNTLGICKHIFRVQSKVRGRFPASVCNRPYRPKSIAVALRYGSELELRLLAPTHLEDSAERLLAPLRNRAIDDAPNLLRRVQQLTAMGHDVTIYPDAEEHINRRLFQDRMSSLVREIRKDPKRHPLRKALLKTELLPYQLDGIAFAAGAGRAILADDMGLGKTIQAIGVAELLAREAGISKVLIVCPASLKSQWRSEAARFCERECRLVLGGVVERARQYQAPAFFTVCNYEQVLRDILAIESVPWDLIVLDEGQRIKNWETKTTRIIKGLKSPFALVLSGTPLENRLDDLFSVTEFIDDRRLGPAFRFFHRHRMVDEKGKVLGYKNLADLRERLRPILLRRTRDAVMKDLPPRTTEIVRITPTAEQAEIHDAHRRIVSQIVRKPFITEMDLLRLRMALLMCRMSADSTMLVDKKLPGYSSKLETLNDLLGSLFAEQNRKAIMFSEWTTMLDLIEGLLHKQRIPFVRLDGSVPQKQRQRLVQTFQEQAECKVFLTTNAGSTGLNLQAANTVINVDLPWNPAVLEQRIGRAHRMGQKNPVQVYILVTEGTIEEQLLSTLSAKKDLAMAALDFESEVEAVNLAGGVEELRQRLEVLLGAKPNANPDETDARRASDEAERLSRKERIALAGGQMLTAAFSMLGELMPATAPDPETQRWTDAFKKQLTDCVERDAQGRLKLALTLPDAEALDRFSKTLAGLWRLQAPVVTPDDA